MGISEFSPYSAGLLTSLSFLGSKKSLALSATGERTSGKEEDWNFYQLIRQGRQWFLDRRTFYHESYTENENIHLQLVQEETVCDLDDDVLIDTSEMEIEEVSCAYEDTGTS